MTGAWKALHALVLRSPAASFYVATLTIGWGAYALVVGPELARGGAMQPQDAWILFPILVLSVGALGVLFSALARERTESLWSRMRHRRIDGRWYLLLALPPVVIFLVLRSLAAWCSPEYAPGFFVWLNFMGAALADAQRDTINFWRAASTCAFIGLR